MAASAIPPLLPFLLTLPAPRQPSRRRHPLDAILALACAAMLAGCDSLLVIAEWGRDPQAGAPLARRLGFTRERTPCVATLHRVFRRLDVAAFETAVGQWASAGMQAVQLLAALGYELGLVLGEVPIDPATRDVAALTLLGP